MPSKRGDLTEHFSRVEFKCKCGKCGRDDIDRAFVNRLEDIFQYLEKCEKGCKYIFVTSGVRCPDYSVSVGGFKNDMHTLGRAADIVVIDENDNYYNPFEIAAVAELFGLGGIGIMDGACHVDDREKGGYANKKWYGDERNGHTYGTFVQYLPAAKVINKHKIALSLDGKTIFESEV